MRAEDFIRFALFTFFIIIMNANLLSAAYVSEKQEVRPSNIIGKDSEGMIIIPIGYFVRGSMKGMDDEAPVRMIFVDAFYIDQYEVTNLKFQRFAEATGYRTTAEKRGWSWVWIKDSWDKVQEAHWR